MQISVIVPVLNEAQVIEPQLEAIRRERPYELVVVDGGSDDGTDRLVEPYSDLLVRESAGLAAQLNAGAELASGDVLLFAYADTKLPLRWLQNVADALRDPTTVGGAFRLGFDSPRLRYRFIARAANLRNETGCGPMGDQAVFVKRQAFQELGGFDESALLEDLDFVCRLRNYGRFVVIPHSVRASVRQWESNGVVRTMLRNWWFLGQHFMGKNDPERRLAYRRYRVSSHGTEGSNR